LPAAHRPGHDGPHGSVSAATYPAVGLLHGRPRSLTTRPQGGDQPCCASARSQEPRPRPQELPLNPESSHIGEYQPQGSVGHARVRPARRRETLPGLLRHASPPLGQVPRQRERQATRRLAAAVLHRMRPDLEGTRLRTRPCPVAGARTPAGLPGQRPGHGARADHERVARREERIPPRLDRHLGTRDGHAPRPAGRSRTPQGPDQLRAAGAGPRRTAAHARARPEPRRGATQGRGRTHPPAAGPGRQGTSGLRVHRGQVRCASEPVRLRPRSRSR
jgi:hypothetical protein